MKAGLGLRLSAALVACACLTPDAFAGGRAKPGVTNTYSAESFAFAPGNVVRIQGGDFLYSVLSGTTLIPNSGVAAVSVTFSAPTGDTFANPGAALCSWNPGGVTTVPVVAANTIVCPNPAAGGPYNSVNLTNPGAGTPIGAITLTGPDVAILGQNIYPNLSRSSSNPSALLPINAQATSGGAFVGDPTPLPNLNLVSQNTFRTSSDQQTLLIDATGSGVAAGNLPGGVFNADAADGTRGVSKTGFLGTIQVQNQENRFRDARTALDCTGGPALGNNPNCATAISGPVTVKLIGDFATLTSAFLLPNTASGGLLVASQANCGSAAAAGAPANANQVAGAIDAAKRTITFAAFTTRASNSVYAVCLTTNGTQVIQPSRIDWVVSVALAGGPTITLTAAPNEQFGSIFFPGSTFLAQNVFGFAQTGTRTYLRAVNQSNTPAQIWAVITNDVANQVPETGAGSCTFPAAATTAQTSPDTPTCNMSFVANLTSTFVTSNAAAGGSQGMLQPNTATYYTGDDIAALAGTTATSATNGFLESTVRLISPNTGVIFSALSQGSTGILVQTP